MRGEQPKLNLWRPWSRRNRRSKQAVTSPIPNRSQNVGLAPRQSLTLSSFTPLRLLCTQCYQVRSTNTLRHPTAPLAFNLFFPKIRYYSADSRGSLYLMKGLTTRFSRPASPKPGLVTRGDMGIPQRPSCEALYMVPQTLFKLHPDFDRLVAGILGTDPSGCVGLGTRLQQKAWCEGCRRRRSGTRSNHFRSSVSGARPVVDRSLQVKCSVLGEGSNAGKQYISINIKTQRCQQILPARGRTILGCLLVFRLDAPRVEQNEFLGLVGLADVVLDPFPVGGGGGRLWRSSPSAPLSPCSTTGPPSSRYRIATAVQSAQPCLVSYPWIDKQESTRR